jgi:hypothetical protein
MEKNTKQRLFEVMGRLDKTFKPKLNETGEWSGDEDDIAWMEALKNEVEKISTATQGKVKLIDIEGFDKYQGPYAIVDIDGKKYNIWTMEDQGQLWIEDYPVDNTSGEKDMRAGFQGNASEIIQMLGSDPNSVTSKDFKFFRNEDIDLDNEENPKTEEQEWEELYQTYINGNLTYFADELKQMDSGILIRFLKWISNNNYKF